MHRYVIGRPLPPAAKLAAALLACLPLAQVQGEEMGVLRKMSENKFAPMSGLPDCATLAVQSGDPAKGPSVILGKVGKGCRIPWHWHTANEHVMMVKGTARLEMKDGGASVLDPGGYGYLPGKHVHRFTCTSQCALFIASDAAFDIHYVDAAGKEIAPEAALSKKK